MGNVMGCITSLAWWYANMGYIFRWLQLYKNKTMRYLTHALPWGENNKISETKGFTSDSAEVYVTVEEINKRSLGKLIVKVVGHEGWENTEAEQVLRRQFQTCITHIDNYSPDTWTDARVTFLGMDGSAYVIQSGDGKKRFIVRLDARDEIKFVDFQKLNKFNPTPICLRLH